MVVTDTSYGGNAPLQAALPDRDLRCVVQVKGPIVAPGAVLRMRLHLPYDVDESADGRLRYRAATCGNQRVGWPAEAVAAQFKSGTGCFQLSRSGRPGTRRARAVCHPDHHGDRGAGGGPGCRGQRRPTRCFAVGGAIIARGLVRQVVSDGPAEVTLLRQVVADLVGEIAPVVGDRAGETIHDRVELLHRPVGEQCVDVILQSLLFNVRNELRRIFFRVGRAHGGPA